MNKTKVKIFQRINEKYRLYLIGLIVILFITSTIFAYIAIGQPLVLEKTNIEDTIEEKTSFDYSAMVRPSTLYPNGGKIVPDGVLYTNLTDKLIIELDSSINTEKPVLIKGRSGVKYSIVSPNIWEREFKHNTKQSINMEGTSNTLLKEVIELDINEIRKFINDIEEETLVRSGNYLLVIKPEITGLIYGEDGSEIYKIESDLEIPFELSGQYIKYAGETAEKVFIKTKTLDNVIKTPLCYYFLGKELSILVLRYIFSIISLLSFALIIIYMTEKSIIKKESMSENNLIDKKYKSKLISVTDKANFSDWPQMGLISFKDLLKIAEEKEEVILRYEDDTEDIVYYYVVVNSTTYYYLSNKNVVAKGVI